MSELAGFWQKLEAAREDSKYKDTEKFLAALGSIGGGKSFSKSTWYSYQRWFLGEGEGPRTSPTVSFLSRVTDLLHVALILDVQSDLRSGQGRRVGGAKVVIKDPDVLFVAELLAQLPREARNEVRQFVLSKVGELTRPPEGDEPNGPRPSPK